MSAESRKITLIQGDDGGWTSHDRRGLTAEGETRTEALENLDTVVEAAEGEGGRPPTDDELRELGIDPEENRRWRDGRAISPSSSDSPRMVTRAFSGEEVVRVLGNAGNFWIDRTTGDHVIMK